MKEGVVSAVRKTKSIFSAIAPRHEICIILKKGCIQTLTYVRHVNAYANIVESATANVNTFGTAQFENSCH